MEVMTQYFVSTSARATNMLEVLCWFRSVDDIFVEDFSAFAWISGPEQF